MTVYPPDPQPSPLSWNMPATRHDPPPTHLAQTGGGVADVAVVGLLALVAGVVLVLAQRAWRRT